MKTLLVEDDVMIGAAVTQALRDAACAVEWMEDGQLASEALERHSFEIVLLDLGLPRRDGLDVLHQMRARGDKVTVIVITAREGLDDRIRGLDLGADDYLVKPFAVSELLARMRAVTRRRAGSAAPMMSNGHISLDPATRQASIGGVEHRLSRREFALLRELLVRPGAILSRAQLEDRIYSWAEEVESNVVEYIIHGLRKKLGPDSIRNVRGLGWMVERAT